MIRGIIMSVQPQHGVNVLNKIKTQELRKTIPSNLKQHIKEHGGIWVYIYITFGDKNITIVPNTNLSEYRLNDKKRISGRLNGKVVAKFWLNEFDVIEGKWTFGESMFGYNDITKEQLKKLCLTDYEVLKYGNGKSKLYAWHIKDLTIFDRPMELKNFGTLDYSEFIKLKRPPQSWQYIYTQRSN